MTQLQVQNAPCSPFVWDYKCADCTGTSRFIRLPSTVYHLTDEHAWQLIQQQGLKSAAQLLQESKLTKQQQHGVLTSQRASDVLLPGSRTVIHDQKPLPHSGLERCLHGMRPSEWYQLVNEQVICRWPALPAEGNRHTLVLLL